MIGTANRNDYVGTGLLTTYSYNFKIYAATDLHLVKRDTNGNESVLSYPTHFSVTGVGGAAGGTVVLVTALGSGYALSLRRVRPLSQATDIRNQAQFNREAIENEFDDLVMQTQQLEDSIERSLRVPESLNRGTYNLVLPLPAANKAIGWSADGKSIVNLDTNVVTPVTMADTALTFLQAGSGAVVRTGRAKMREVFSVFDFGAAGDGVQDDGAYINTALTDAASAGGGVLLPQGTFKSTARLIVPASVSFFGVGKLSKIQSAMTLGSADGELVRLGGDYASCSNMWLHGRGQDPNNESGDRGIWIGNSVDHVIEGRVNYARVENVWIDAFQGNGISGDYWHAMIMNCTIFGTTDACIFLQPTSSYSLIQGCTLYGCRYSGIDCNGSNNRIVGNDISGNGLGTHDLASWNGILLASLTDAKPCEFNIIEGNRIYDNHGCGVCAFGDTGGAITVPARGNIIRGNIISGHTDTSGVHLPSGISVQGGDQVLIEGNVCYANRDNFVVAGAGGLGPIGVILAHNQSINATRDGFLLIHTPRLDLAGDYPPVGTLVQGNIDRGAGRDSFRCQSSGVIMYDTKLKANRSYNPTGYCYNNVASGSHYTYDFDQDNFGTGAGTAYQNGFDAVGFANADTTPSVRNGHLYHTNNAGATSITSLDDGVMAQEITVQFGDGNTTFVFGGGNLRGNNGSPFLGRNGDHLTAKFDGTYWQCRVHNSPVAYSSSTAIDQSAGVGVGKAKTCVGNFMQGTINTDAAALANETTVQFTFNNSFIAAGDAILVMIAGGPNAADYKVSASNNGAGTCEVFLRNINRTTAHSDTVVIRYLIIKAF